MIDILNHYTLGFDQDRHPAFGGAPYKLSGYGAVAKARVNIFCFLKKTSDTCPAREGPWELVGEKLEFVNFWLIYL